MPCSSFSAPSESFWAICWYLWFRDDPADHPGVNAAELEKILAGRRFERPHRLSFAKLLAGLPLAFSALADVSGGVITDYATRRLGLRWGRAGIGLISCLGASVAMLAGATVRDGRTAAILIALAAGSSCLMAAASWSVCIDIGGNQTGLVGAMMNTAGQVGGVLSPIVLAVLRRNLWSWSVPLYLIGLLYGVGALAWILVDANRPLASAKVGTVVRHKEEH